MALLRPSGLLAAALLPLLSFGAFGADTRLADAAQKSDVAAVKALLKQKVDVNGQQADGMTPLLWSAHNDDVAIADVLIKAGADVKSANRYGILPIAEAATNGSAAMVDLLLKAGADPNSTLPESDTVLMLAARAGSAPVMKLLLEKGAKADAREEWHGDSALMIAAAKNNVEAVKVLLEHGADPNAAATHLEYPNFKTGPAQVMSVYPKGGLTALMHAARDNAYDAAQALLTSKADPNLKDPNKMTAMQIAIMNGHWDMVKLMLDNGADANDGSLGLAVDVKGLKYIRAATSRPDKLNNMDVIRLLLERGAKVDTPLEATVPLKQNFTARVTGPADATPLMRAAKAPDVEVMKLLIEKGADAKIVVKDGTTPLMVAAGSGPRGGGMAAAADEPDQKAMIEAIKLCMDKGADINTVDTTGATALHGAAGKGVDDVVKFLVEHGAKMDVKDKRGRTPLDVAMGAAGNGPVNGMAPRAQPHPTTAALLRKLMGLPEISQAEEEKQQVASAQ
jgi:uncharacterized protein